MKQAKGTALPMEVNDPINARGVADPELPKSVIEVAGEGHLKFDAVTFQQVHHGEHLSTTLGREGSDPRLHRLGAGVTRIRSNQPSRHRKSL